MGNQAKKSAVSSGEERRKRPRRAPGFGSRIGLRLVEGMTKAELVSAFAPKVELIARQISERRIPSFLSVEDLVAVGHIGLMNAADRFDARRGFKFTTYAEFRIRGAILDELRRHDCVPRTIRDSAREIDRAAQRLEARQGRQPCEREVAAELGIGLEELQRRKRENDGRLSSRESGEETDRLDRSDPQESLQQEEVRSRLQLLMERALDAEERLVIACYYYRGLNLREISEILGVSESRISQIHVGAIRKLRERDGGQGEARTLMLCLLSAA